MSAEVFNGVLSTFPPFSFLISIVVGVMVLFVLPELHLRLEQRATLKRRRQAAPDPPPIRVASLVIYPVKSCGGIAVQEASCTARGLSFDRQWMVVYGATGRMVTQRQVPRMALIQPVGLPGPVSERGSSSSSSGGGAGGDAPLILEAPGMPTLRSPVVDSAAGGDARTVHVWEDQCPGVDQGEAAAAWLSKFMGREAAEAAGAEAGTELAKLRLVCFPPGARRPADPKYSRGAEAGAYSDGFPFLVISDESLRELNARLPEGATPLPMDRFRPNIVISGSGAPFLEDQWDRIKLVSAAEDASSYVSMRIVKPCSRCKIPTTDQLTGKQDEPPSGAGEAEPTRTLRLFRTGRALRLPNIKWRDEVFFGQNAVMTGGGGMEGGWGEQLQWLWQWLMPASLTRLESIAVRVGDQVVVERKQAWVTWGM